MKVLYVMGAGRSGSSILGVALGNCEGVFYAGELDKWLPRAGVSPLGGAEREAFWGEVAEQLRRARADAAEMFGTAARALERSSALLDPTRIATRRRLRPAYRRIARELYGALARVTGAAVIVDSSHYPMRARELQSTPGVELYLLLLVRDPRGVVASLRRTDVRERSMSPLAANAYLWLTGLLSAHVFVRQPRSRRLLVRFEDLAADPHAVLGRVAAMWGGSCAAADPAALRTGPVFQANRLVRSETVSLRPPGAPPREPLTMLAQAPLLALLGRLRPAARARPGAAGTAGTR